MKRLIIVTTPGNGKTYEFTVEPGVRTGAARRSVVQEIMSFEDGKIHLDENRTVLCSVKYSEERPDSTFLFEGKYANDCEFLLV